MHHDDVLGRLTDGAGRLDRMTAAALKRVPFRDSAERMITLGELCDLVAGRAAMLLELKSRFDGDSRLPAARGGRPRRISRPGRRRCRSIRGSSTCCGINPLACRAELLQQSTGRTLIGIGCHRWLRYGMGSLLRRP